MATPADPKPPVAPHHAPADTEKDVDKDETPAPRASSSSTSPMRHATPPKGPTYKFAVDAKVRRTGFDSPLTVVRQQPTHDGHPQYALQFWYEDGDAGPEPREFVALEDELEAWKDV